MDSLSVLRHFLWWRDAERLDAGSIEKLQRKKMRGVLASALETEHYGKILDREVLGLDMPAELEALPITEKPDIRDRPESFVRRGMDIKRLTMYQTSGATGTPTRVYFDKEVLLYRTAARYATDCSFGRSPVELYAHIYFADMEPSVLLKRTGLFPKLFLSVFASEEKNLEIMRKRRPRVLRGYPSTLLPLARLNAQAKDRVRLRSVICDSEVLTKEMQDAMEESFSCPVYNHYGSMEASSIARECPEGRKLHVDSFNCIVEIVDEKGKPKKSGEGEIVVTPLFNTTMPLLRYRIGDRASWGNECGCGRSLPVLKNISGRSDDHIILPSGRMRPAITFYLKPELLAHLREYQIDQKERDRIVFRYVASGKEVPSADLEQIRQGILGACLGEQVRVEFEATSALKKERTGKLRTVISQVKP